MQYICRYQPPAFGAYTLSHRTIQIIKLRLDVETAQCIFDLATVATVWVNKEHDAPGFFFCYILSLCESCFCFFLLFLYYPLHYNLSLLLTIPILCHSIDYLLNNMSTLMMLSSDVMWCDPGEFCLLCVPLVFSAYQLLS